MIRLLLKCIARGLARRLSEERIAAAMGRLPPAVPHAAFETEMDAVRVCAVQAEAKLFRSLDAFVRETDAYFRDATQERADLVCFPEFYGVLLTGVSPAVRLLVRVAGRQAAGTSSGGPASAGPPALGELLAPFAFLNGRYLFLAGLFAKRYGVYVSCGTCLAVENGRVYNRHTLLGPDGATVCCADKLHLTAEEQALGISAGDALGIVSLPIGRVALCVCMDATYFETFRAAKALGADYILVPIADMAAFDPWLALRGAQSRVSETGLIAVKAALTSGEGFPLTFTGKAGVYFPLETGETPLESPDWRRRHAVCTELSLKSVRAFRPRLFCRRNPAFNQRYLNELLHNTERNTNDANKT